MNAISSATIRRQQSWWHAVKRRLCALITKENRECKIRIVCVRGVVWVTKENDARDYFVQGGETLCFPERSRVVAQAIGEADFRVERCTQRRAA